jgi:integrase
MARQSILSALELTGEDDEYLFPSPSVDDAPITAHALAVAMARFAESLNPIAGKSWRADSPSPHDLRRTVATRLAELGVAKEDRDAVLNHTPADVGKKHYDLYDREREKRRALELWASTLSAIIEGQKRGAEVVPTIKTHRN